MREGVMTQQGEPTAVVETIRVRDAARIREFEGYRIAEVSTDNQINPRWTEMELYRTADGRYVLCIIGRSVVYHQHGGSCNSGVPTPIAKLERDLLEELEPCMRCAPAEPEDLPSVNTIDMEEDRHAAHVCDVAADVIAKLRDPKSASGSISGPGQRLLATAARVDDGIRAQMTHVERI